MTSRSETAPALATVSGKTSRVAPKTWILLAAALVLITLAYVPVVDGPFMWDDRELVLESPRVSELRPFSEYFGSAFWLVEEVEPGGRSYYRPLTILSLALDYRVHGPNPAGFHLTNVLLHLGCAWAIFALLCRRRVPPLGALVGTLAWGLFPRLTEDVAWVSGRTDVLATGFVLVAFLALGTDASASRSASPALWRNWAAALTLLFGLLSKEVAAAGLLALTMFELTRCRGSRWTRRALGVLPYVACAAVYLLLRARAIDAQLSRSALDPWQRVLAAFEAAGRYTYMLANPWQPDIQLGLLGRLDFRFVALGVVSTGALIVGLRLGRRRLHLQEPWQRAALALSLTSLGLVLHIVPTSIVVVAADRFLYMPLAGAVLLVVPPLCEQRRWGRLSSVVAVGLLAGFLVATSLRASQWADEVDFWMRGVRQQGQENGRARVELGSVYFRAGLHDHALSLWLDADRADPSDSMALNNLGAALAATGHYRESAAVLEDGMKRTPWRPLLHLNLALSALSRLRFDNARDHAEQALRLYPQYDLAKKLVRALPELGKLATQLRSPPSTIEERVHHAHLFGLFGRSSDAVRAWVEIAQDPKASAEHLREGLLLALRVGDAHSTRVIYENYRQRAPRRDDDPLHVAYQERAEQARRLLSGWPELGIDLVSTATPLRLGQASATPPPPQPTNR